MIGKKGGLFWSLLLMLFILRGISFQQAGWVNFGLLAFVNLVAKNATTSSLSEVSQVSQLLQSVSEKSSHNQTVLRSLGIVLIIQGDEKSAKAIWDSGKNVDQLFIQYGALAISAKNYTDALIWYQYAKNSFPYDSEACYQIGRIYRRQQAWDKSVQAFQQATQRYPNRRDAWYELGRSYVATGDFEAALSAFRSGLEATNEGDVGGSVLYYHIGRLYQSPRYLGDLSAAQQAYYQALDRDDFQTAHGKMSDTYRQLGKIAAKKHQWETAIQAYKDALAINPAHYSAYIDLASTLWELDQRAEAKFVVLQAVEIKPDEQLAYDLLGGFYEAEGNFDAAKAIYQKRDFQNRR